MFIYFLHRRLNMDIILKLYFVFITYKMESFVLLFIENKIKKTREKKNQACAQKYFHVKFSNIIFRNKIIKMPKQASDHCKLCLKLFKTGESRHRLTEDLVSRLDKVGVFFEEKNENESLCRICFRAIGKLEKSDLIKENWVHARTAKRKRVEVVLGNDDNDNRDNEIVTIFLFNYFFTIVLMT